MPTESTAPESAAASRSLAERTAGLLVPINPDFLVQRIGLTELASRERDGLEHDASLTASDRVELAAGIARLHAGDVARALDEYSRVTHERAEARGFTGPIEIRRVSEGACALRDADALDLHLEVMRLVELPEVGAAHADDDFDADEAIEVVVARGRAYRDRLGAGE